LSLYKRREKKMDEIADIMQQIERLRSKLVDFTIQTGDFMQEGVLHLSRRLDELIIRYYALITNKESSDFKIA
jgi:3',5'-cyclic AMP phosphodiesterase CpdA